MSTSQGFAGFLKLAISEDPVNGPALHRHDGRPCYIQSYLVRANSKKALLWMDKSLVISADRAQSCPAEDRHQQED